MMINKTTEYMNYRQTFNTGLERTPRFLRRDPVPGNVGDIVDISDAARKRMLEKNNTSLVKAVLRVTQELGELVRIAEGEADARRSARIEELRAQVREGSYDFENAGSIGSAASSIMARREIRHNTPDCA